MYSNKFRKVLFLVLFSTYLYGNDRLTDEPAYFFDLQTTLISGGIAVVLYIIAFACFKLDEDIKDISLLKIIGGISFALFIIFAIPVAYYVMAIIASIWIFGFLGILILGGIIILIDNFRNK